MVDLETRVAELTLRNERVTLSALGGSDAIRQSEGNLSPVFGVVAGAVATHWDDVDDAEPMIAFLAKGFQHNKDRLALRESIEAVYGLPKETYRSFVMALDARTRDPDEHPILKAEAMSGLMRFALCDQRWTATACAGLQAYEFGSDPLADPLVCRLTSVAYEQFAYEEALDLLESFVEHQSSRAQANLERGLVQISIALESATVEEISEELSVAAGWLEAAVLADPERRDSSIYYLLVRSLLSMTDKAAAAFPETVQQLREEAFVSELWDRPAPGMEWLFPPSYAPAAWVPMVDKLSHLAGRLSEPSWLDASVVLEELVQVYSINRAVRPGAPDIGKFVRPAIEAAFLRERGLMGHLDQWLSRGKFGALTETDAQQLRHNLQSAINEEGPPEKL